MGVLHDIPYVDAPFMVALALATTSLGVLLPVFRDSGHLDTPFGSLFLAAGTVGEVGPIVVMSLLLSHRYSTWQEVGFLVAFLGIVVVAAAIGMAKHPPRVLAFFNRTMHASAQLPVRMSLLLVAGFFVLAQELGFESIFGAFAAGMLVGLVTRGESGQPMRAKIDAVFFGWFSPFFFVGTGIRFDLPALDARPRNHASHSDVSAAVPAGSRRPGAALPAPSQPAERVPFALASGVASLSIIVVITEIGLRAGRMSSDIAAALVGAALLSIMIFPTVAHSLLSAKPGSIRAA